MAGRRHYHMQRSPRMQMRNQRRRCPLVHKFALDARVFQLLPPPCSPHHHCPSNGPVAHCHLFIGLREAAIFALALSFLIPALLCAPDGGLPSAACLFSLLCSMRLSLPSHHRTYKDPNKTKEISFIYLKSLETYMRMHTIRCDSILFTCRFYARRNRLNSINNPYPFLCNLSS